MKYNKLQLTSSLAQAGVWLDRHRTGNIIRCSRPNFADSPACRQAATTLEAMRGRHSVRRTKTEY